MSKCGQAVEEFLHHVSERAMNMGWLAADCAIIPRLSSAPQLAHAPCSCSPWGFAAIDHAGRQCPPVTAGARQLQHPALMAPAPLAGLVAVRWTAATSTKLMIIKRYHEPSLSTETGCHPSSLAWIDPCTGERAEIFCKPYEQRDQHEPKQPSALAAPARSGR